MLQLPKLSPGNQTRTFTEVFGGYNHNLKIDEGEWYASENLTSAHYPLFAQRPQRGTFHTGSAPIKGIMAKDALAWVEGDRLYYNGYPVPGITLSAESDDLPRQLVSMGAYLCIFPDNVYVNTQNLSDCGPMGQTYTSEENGEVSYQPCTSDGEVYEDLFQSASAPENPANGDMWLDSADNVLKQYSQSSGLWTEVASVYVKISAPGIGQGFDAWDGVRLSGCQYGENGDLHDRVATLNGDVILESVSDDAIVITGLLPRRIVQTTGAITLERPIPRMKYVCEANNRLWGCYYGMSDGKVVNEIYACKLGDFKNWQCFMGIASDSYRVSLGTDGDFTGGITYLGYPTFFKENCIHKIYGSLPSAYQVQTTQCRGVQKGSWASLAILNEVLYYKSDADVCAYDGSLPRGISQPLGDITYQNACAGAGRGKYMISMQDANRQWHLFAYDPEKGLWHREDATHCTGFAHWGQELYYIDGDQNAIIATFGSTGTLEDPVVWWAESGIIGYALIDRKYVSRFNFRMKLDQGASVDLAIEYDSSGVWENQGTVTGQGTEAFMFPVIPKRCDHFRIRLSGRGGVRIYAMSKILEQGSDA